MQLSRLLLVGSLLASAVAAPAASGPTLDQLVTGWNHPARTYKPHTRWWWPGNALTKQDITFQLEQMAAQGMGGVEIMSAWKMYSRGNHDYLSPEFLDLVRHAVAEAKRLDLEVALTFSPGWSFGGPWVPAEDQSRVLCCGSADVAGGTRFSGKLPLPTFPRAQQAHIPADPGRLVAVVAGRLTGKDKLDGNSLVVLPTPDAAGGAMLDWTAPEGTWRLMAFWLKPTGQECQAQNANPPAMVIDHLNRGAVQRYCDYLGGVFQKTVGSDFGTTVDSFFCDSFEIHPLPNSLLWSYDTLERLNRSAGYDFTRYLPALWFDVGELTPRLRYDLGAGLHDIGLDTVFRTFGDWSAAHHVQARIQPHYRFMPELVQAAGAVARPETEVTTARFETVVDPRKATASGARFYGRDFISAEAYTFIHPARYRTDLADLKIATDAFLRDGVTQFYNHGYFASPEMHVAPSRDMPWANRISHWNTWWPYYHLVADYVARSCFLLRQGRLVADVLIYSPQATAWSERALWGTDRRVMPYGNLGKTLVANGYDYDVVNDDLLQHAARFRDGGAEINGHPRRVLILPRATVVPVATMRAIAAFADAGGTVIALEELPHAAAGLRDHDTNDREVQTLVRQLFGGEGKAGGARLVFLPGYNLDRRPFNPMRQPYSSTPALTQPQRDLLAALARVAPPDFALAGRAQSDGLTFTHHRVGDADIYFVCNLEPTAIATDVTFRIAGRKLERWDAITGERRQVIAARSNGAGTTLALNFAAWESAFFVFVPERTTDATLMPPAPALPAAGELSVTGPWKMRLEGYGFETFDNRTTLASWTDSPRTAHFSGTGRYECDFELPVGWQPGKRVVLDLGRVGNLADVQLNERKVGVAWMAPYRLDVTAAVRPGRNRLVVSVTNTLINYVTGLKEPPDIPAELQPRLGAADPTIYPQSKLAYREMRETDLPPSGLIGPVKLLW